MGIEKGRNIIALKENDTGKHPVQKFFTTRSREYAPALLLPFMQSRAASDAISQTKFPKQQAEK